MICQVLSGLYKFVQQWVNSSHTVLCTNARSALTNEDRTSGNRSQNVMN